MSYIFGKFGMSNLGNTSGTSGTVNRGIVFAGGNNITLSQSVNASSATLTIFAASQTAQTQNLHNITLAGNTAGVMAQVSSGTLSLAGGNNITLSQNGNAVTISAASQSVQTQNLHNVTLAGNTAGAMAQISSGTLNLAGGNNITLSQNGNSVSIIGGAGGPGGGGIALANSETTYTSGTANLAVAGGALTIASTTGQSFNFSVPQTSSLSAVAPIGISTNGSTISIGMQDKTASSFVNMLPASTGSQTLGALGIATGSAQFYPVSIESNIQFNALRVAMQLSFATTSASGNQSISHTFGLFSNNANTLSLISSNSLSYAVTNSSVSATLSAATATATTGYGYGTVSASATAQIQSLFGTGGLKVVALQFGNSISLSAGMYWLGFMRRESSSSANIGISAALAGNVVGPINSMAPIGSASSAQTTNFTLRGPYGGFGPYTSTGSAGYGGTALPTSVFMSGIAHTGSILPFMTFIST